MSSCVLGFSGVLFGLLGIDSTLRDDTPRRVLWTVVPAAAYPWVMLLLISFFMPGSSFLGHFCGLVVGLLYAKGWFDPLVPSNARLMGWERSLPFYLHPQFCRLGEASFRSPQGAEWAAENRPGIWQRFMANSGSARAYQPVSQHDAFADSRGFVLGSGAAVGKGPPAQAAMPSAPAFDDIALETWACLRCTFNNPAVAAVCQMCGAPPNGPQPSAPPPSPPQPSPPPQYAPPPPQHVSPPPQYAPPPPEPSAPEVSSAGNGKTNLAHVSRLLQPPASG